MLEAHVSPTRCPKEGEEGVGLCMALAGRTDGVRPT